MTLKTLKVISTIINWLLIIALIFVAALVFINMTSEGNPQIFGQELKVVYSGSMEPEIKTGSVIGIIPAVDKDNYKVDDIIMFQSEPGVYVTHRIMDVFQNNSGVLYQTKGDNNEHPDTNPVMAANVYGKYSGLHIPYLGYVMDFANSKFGLVALLIIPGVLLLIQSGKSLYEGITELRKQKNQSAISNEAKHS